MLSRSLSDCQSLTFNVMLQVSTATLEEKKFWAKKWLEKWKLVSNTDPNDCCHSYSNLCRKPNKKSASVFPFQGCNGEDVDYDYDHQQAIWCQPIRVCINCGCSMESALRSWQVRVHQHKDVIGIGIGVLLVLLVTIVTFTFTWGDPHHHRHRHRNQLTWDELVKSKIQKT